MKSGVIKQNSFDKNLRDIEKIYESLSVYYGYKRNKLYNSITRIAKIQKTG